ncbi:MAG: response regulator, partial [Paraburkholderia sp.]
MKILVIDDHPVLREGIAALLLQDGADTIVLQAGSGAEAIGLINEHDDLDAVVLDLRLPDMSGFQALAAFVKI